MTPAVKAFSWDADLRHAPGSPDPTGNMFQCRCRCGYLGQSNASPSAAYQNTRLHAEKQNALEKKYGVPEPGSPEPSSRPSVASPRPSRPRVATGAQTPCGCGCGEPSGGLFRPGHDSKLLSRLLTSVRARTVTLEDALAEMTKIGCSDKLKAKFEGKVNG
jgi:hypothetical protein